jgi:hypothetical protein
MQLVSGEQEVAAVDEGWPPIDTVQGKAPIGSLMPLANIMHPWVGDWPMGERLSLSLLLLVV